MAADRTEWRQIIKRASTPTDIELEFGGGGDDDDDDDDDDD